jgi:hypothetical protein
VGWHRHEVVLEHPLPDSARAKEKDLSQDFVTLCVLGMEASLGSPSRQVAILGRARVCWGAQMHTTVRSGFKLTPDPAWPSCPKLMAQLSL